MTDTSPWELGREETQLLTPADSDLVMIVPAAENTAPRMRGFGHLLDDVGVGGGWLKTGWQITTTADTIRLRPPVGATTVPRPVTITAAGIDYRLGCGRLGRARHRQRPLGAAAAGRAHVRFRSLDLGRVGRHLTR